MALPPGSTPPTVNEPRIRSRLMRAVPTVAAIMAIAVCIMAGEWQRSRMHGKEALQVQFDAAQAAPPLETRNLPTSSIDWAALRYRPVALDGSFDAHHRILLDNRVHAGRVGFEAYAPFVLDDGRVLLVDRGWLPQGASRADVPTALPPAGPVRLGGQINLPPPRYFELKPEVAPGAIWQHLDLARFRAATGLPIMPIVIEQTAPTGAGDELMRDRPAQDFGIDTHRIYMVQWYAFAAVAAAFWLVAHWPRRTRVTGGDAIG